jgi:hypothetical protein
MLYFEWLLAWFSLRHAPRPSLDDPKAILGSSWLHSVTTVVLMAGLLIALGGIVLNLRHFDANGVSPARVIRRLVVIILLWSALFVLLHVDPGGVFAWWMD